MTPTDVVSTGGVVEQAAKKTRLDKLKIFNDIISPLTLIIDNFLLIVA